MICTEKDFCRSLSEKFEYVCAENENLDKAYIILSQIHITIKSMKCKFRHKASINPSETDRLIALNALDADLDVFMENLCTCFEEIEDKTDSLHYFLFKDVTDLKQQDRITRLFQDIEEIQIEVDDLISESEEKIYKFLHSIQKEGENQKSDENAIVLILNV